MSCDLVYEWLVLSQIEDNRFDMSGIFMETAPFQGIRRSIE